jgi:VacB/RNase II family 3'-5' exoribonuclease
MKQPNLTHKEQLGEIAREAMSARDLLTDFSRRVRGEIDQIERRPSPAEKDRRDLRALLWSSIDNDDSRDIDQVTMAERADADAIRVRVAIADVAVHVDPRGPVDEHAAYNTTSVYTPALIFPMLPVRLCYDLTSLNAGEDRAAVVAEFTVEPSGALRDGGIYLATVRNQAKLTYDGVGAYLSGTRPFPRAAAEITGLEENLRLQHEAATRLRKRRHEHGALELQTISARPRFLEDGRLHIEIDGRNPAKELIEDLMIAANTVTARFLREQQLPSLRRVVRKPGRWEKIIELAAVHGTALPDRPDSKALTQFMREQRKQDLLRFPDLSLTVIKLIGSGEYVVEHPGDRAIGHFGLAVRDYTHSTAPNRRYPDLITQRMLTCALRGDRQPYDSEELEGLAKHCTQKEDDADKVERRVNKAALALLLEDRIGERFDALVTGAAQKGTWVRILDPPVEGKLLSGDFGVDVGDRIRVELIGTDASRGYIDFRRCE